MSGGAGPGAPDAGAPDAIVLAGGRGSRLGGADKAAIELGEQRLVDRAVVAARSAGAARVIVVGPPHTGALADAVVREDPPFSGPAAALGAALPQLRATWVMVLACDLVHPDTATRLLGAAHAARSDTGSDGTGSDGTILVDEEGRRQWLLACYRSDSLRAALTDATEASNTADASNAAEPATGNPLANLSLRSRLAGLRLREVSAASRILADIDTPDHLALAVAETAPATDAPPPHRPHTPHPKEARP